MNVAFIPIAQLDGKETERKSFGDKQFDLKIMSLAKPGLVSLEFSGTTIAVDAKQLLSAIQGMVATNTAKAACA
jgi:hypothetical protein